MFPWNLFPFNKKFNNPMGQINQNEIEKFVKEMMNQMMPSQMQDILHSQDWTKQKMKQEEPPSSQNSNHPLSYSVFETHHHIYIRILIKDEAWLSQMKLFHTSNQLIVEHIPNDEDKLTIILPAIVRKKGTTANYKDGVLEIKLLKNIDMQFSEIEVTEN